MAFILTSLTSRLLHISSLLPLASVSPASPPSLLDQLGSGRVLQVVALALSIFNLVAFLWLACTVWLNGDRRSMIARVGVVGLGLAALFFFIHALLISSPLTITIGVVSSDFL